MKGRHELIALVIMLIMCLIFAACAQKVEDKLTDKATDPSLLTSAKTDSGFVDGKKDTTDQTKEAAKKPLTDKEAADKLKMFYGTLYDVEETGEQTYIINDNNGKEYARVKVDLNSRTFDETITERGEKSTISFDDIRS